MKQTKRNIFQKKNESSAACLKQFNTFINASFVILRLFHFYRTISEQLKLPNISYTGMIEKWKKNTVFKIYYYLNSAV